MGEAKRRRKIAAERQQQPIQLFDEGGQRVGLTEVRQSADSISAAWGKLEASSQGRTATVPCNGCRACCWSSVVPVDANTERPEDIAHLDLVQNDDGRSVLRKRDDGACVHLGDDSCTVYEHRPSVCRTYDCRVFSMFGWQETYDGGQVSPTWNFPLKQHQDRILFMAMRMAGVIHWNPDDRESSMTEAIANLPKHVPTAKEFIAKFDALSPEEREKEMAVVKRYKEQIFGTPGANSLK